MRNKHMIPVCLIALIILGITDQTLMAETPTASSQLAARAQEMAAENVGLITIIEYQTTLLAYSETNPEQAADIRQTRDQCTALLLRSGISVTC